MYVAKLIKLIIKLSRSDRPCSIFPPQNFRPPATPSHTTRDSFQLLETKLLIVSLQLLVIKYIFDCLSRNHKPRFFSDCYNGISICDAIEFLLQASVCCDGFNECLELVVCH